MGGRGSGRRFRWASKATVEQLPCIDVREIQRKGGFRFWGQRPWELTDQQGRAVGEITITTSPQQLTVAYGLSRNGEYSEPFNYSIPLDWTNCHYGGRRAWFRCPAEGCGRRVCKLYLRGQYFFCRPCHNLAYQSQHEDRPGRLRWRAQQIRAKLGGSMNLFDPFPPRPKYMRRFKYWLLDMKADHWANKSLEMALAKLKGEKM